MIDPAAILASTAAVHPNSAVAGELAASDGHRVATYHWPHPSPRVVLVLAHGMSEHAGRYEVFAQALNAAGVAVMALDHRGHGRSVHDGRWGHFADRDGWACVLGDLDRVLDWAEATYPNLPRVLFGHSMGSYMARAYTLRAGVRLDGLVLSAPGFRQALLARILGALARRLSHQDQPSRLMGRLVFGSFNLRFLPARTPFDWLSAAPEAVDRYQRDPLCGFDCTPALWADLLGGIVALEAGEAEGAALPTGLRVLAMAGTHDPVSLGGLGCTQLARRYRAAGVEDVTSRRYPHGRHELLNDLEASTVTADLLHWIDERWPG